MKGTGEEQLDKQRMKQATLVTEIKGVENFGKKA